MSKLPEDGTVVPKHVAVLNVSTAVYAVCAFGLVKNGDYSAWSKQIHKSLPSKTPKDFLRTDNNLTGNLAKFHHISFDIY